MRPSSTQIIAALSSVFIYMFIHSIHQHGPQSPPAHPSYVATTTATRAAAPPPPLADARYPDDRGIGARDIYSFLSVHPNANLTRLWQRLGVTKDNSRAQFNSTEACSCEVNLFEYQLDNDAAPETVLQIKQWESYRYLIFKGPENESKLIGHIDVYARHTPSDPIVFLSNGRTWLVVQATDASGTGLIAYRDTVYEVADGRVRPVASYLANVRQSDLFFVPTMQFVARPLSCEIRDGEAILTVSYKVEYSSDIPLFSKQQNVVLIGSLKNGSTRLGAADSEVQPSEFDSIYNNYWMNDVTFARYNRAELREIALGKDAKKKEWLREFLDHCKSQSIRRELLPLLK